MSAFGWMDYSIRPAGWLGYFLTATSGRKASTPVPVSRIRQTYRLSRDITSIILGWKMKNDLGARTTRWKSRWVFDEARKIRLGACEGEKHVPSM
jgi:hypothetical protein